MKPFVDIRALTPGDIDAVAATHSACFEDAWSSAMIRRILAMPGAFGLAAMSTSRRVLVGFALGRVVADDCELLSIAVAPAWRGHGVGTRLLDAAMAWAKANHAKKFFLEVAEGNSAALRLYERRGLVQVGRRPEYYELKNGAFVDALTMRCDLAAPELDAAAGRVGRPRPPLRQTGPLSSSES
jgi:ribosomal-protein-alanine N-acetyltransferase